MAICVYISGPMSGYPLYNYPAFEKAEKILHSVGYRVVSPHRSGGGPKFSWETNMRFALELLLRCDGVALLPHYMESPGSMLELMVGQQLGLAVHELDQWLHPMFVPPAPNPEIDLFRAHVREEYFRETMMRALAEGGPLLDEGIWLGRSDAHESE